MLDSCGISGTGETPQARPKRAEEAHRPPRGKRAPGAQISHHSYRNNVYKNSRYHSRSVNTILRRYENVLYSRNRLLLLKILW
ncbi:hypothetical protein FBF83_10610 [Pseudalkalibacillus hwajinpoensis]|uniref:Uncharacterized protein n=1 Tax=Guptibacillus hwajinpoensis TaxID=208199 RepID=A0A4U1MKT7_9BACL|nr:hypothetical protein FBF83_10610 [Pseudalkalibacillus hwajinpoensis]